MVWEEDAELTPMASPRRMLEVDPAGGPRREHRSHLLQDGCHTRRSSQVPEVHERAMADRLAPVQCMSGRWDDTESSTSSFHGDQTSASLCDGFYGDFFWFLG
jgi:hypothetical protein